MKKIIVLAISLIMGNQAFAQWHGHYQNNNNHRPEYSRYNDNSRGEWRHTNHNGQLAWWFVVGSAFYLSEQAYLNEYRYAPIYNKPIIINSIPAPSINYGNPVYVQPTYVPPTYVPRYGWYCENTGMFSTGAYDTCPTPWVSRQY